MCRWPSPRAFLGGPQEQWRHERPLLHLPCNQRHIEWRERYSAAYGPAIDRPTKDSAAPRRHDFRCDYLLALSGLLPHLPRLAADLRARRHNTLPGDGAFASDLFFDSVFAHDPGRGDRTPGAGHFEPRIAGALRQASRNCSMDISHLALRFCDGRSDLFHAVSVVCFLGERKLRCPDSVIFRFRSLVKVCEACAERSPASASAILEGAPHGKERQ